MHMEIEDLCDIPKLSESSGYEEQKINGCRYYAVVCYSIENYSLLTHCSAMMLLVMDDILSKLSICLFWAAQGERQL